MANYLPLYFNMEKRPILIFGGGAKALDKIEKLLPYDPAITVAACKVTPTVKLLKEENKIALVRSDFTDIQEQIEKIKPQMVIIADADPEKIPAIFKICRKNGLEVNTVDKKEYCTFIFPSVIKRKNLSVAVSTFGASPAAAKWIREHIERTLPAAIDNMLEYLSGLRRKLMERPDFKSGKFTAMYREFLDAALRENRMLSPDEMAQIMMKYINEA